MRALLLAAGLGTRLRPITDTVPKCLVPIDGKPLLGYWLENLSKAGVNEFLINTSYLSEQVEVFIKENPHAKKVTLVYEEELLNTGGTLLANRDFFKEEPFMLVHADNLSFCDFKAFIAAHVNRPSGCEITMMSFKTDNPSACGIVELDEVGVVQKFHEKVENPPSNLANGAVYICEPNVLKFIESLGKKEVDFSLDVLPHFMGKISTFLNEVYHRDIGTPQSYALAQLECRTLL
ncbi:MAG: nucleotidyltransferase family protein [Epsilonproteobacteria bacterium]|nr:nucleotidyltransferase family protein [Campylobacterota bacterium]OIO16580.1 MAG: mannose-1-phosphate guanylyltransferase [Helicobacteraceae bacterium CG1_02_36_14]PIP11077.1 MAG: mannose-1-phosphate guanylyltransferase [Sulfurimonas sp. CG23_combo_of_CG06-09_8_20_14_all_36_33]PIS24173.1 MAG: mannose-1-phosphate guanylyltransferase [Sulfurimonas sp. CG08_land_8_20_14_0_20_36_33]PIU33792.1 MAG: mannose-1-phosphate guanylyltransferase [Sulfurimonas sp. CG07_land_8_20_14_0_80_36_56]PIV04330.1 